MMLRLASHAAKVLLALIWVSISALSADARIVAILFDTSGSMNERYNLPSFGARLLAGTIDGRAGFDRLLVMNFNHYAQTYGGEFPIPPILLQYAGPDAGQLQDITITNGVQHQDVVEALRGTFASADVGTPYGPLEVMLDRIVREVAASQDDEEVVFVVVSDGSYHDGTTDFDGGRQVDYMRGQFEAFRSRIDQAGGSLRAEYLLIDASGGLESKVRDQGVRDTLLEVFNGPQRDAQGRLTGARTVSSPDRLWEALKDIIAKVAGTDRETQRPFVRYSGQQIEVESPLSISRIVIVSTANADATLPTRQDDTLGVEPTDSRRITMRMDGPDRDFTGAPERQGLVEHLWFQDAVQAGTYTLEFDAPVDEDVFLLFETSSLINLKIIDANGNVVMPDAQGVHTLYKDRDYRFESQILDGIDAASGQGLVVDLDTLPQSLSMLLSLGGPVGPGTSSMTVNRAADVGTFDWTPDTIGDVAAFARATAGILSPSSERLRLSVVDATTDLTITPLRSEAPCPGCGSDQVTSPIEAESSEDVLVGEFDIEADGAFDGAITFGPSEIPEGFELRDKDGNVIDPNAIIEFGAQDTQTFELWRKGGVTTEQLARGAADVEISVAPAGEWTGAPVQRNGTVLLNPPGLSLDLVAVSEPITPGEVDGLKVPGGEMLLGQFSAQFALNDIVIPPDRDRLSDATDITSNRFTDRLVRFELDSPDPRSVGFNALEIRPESRYWCLCWIFLENAALGTNLRQIDVAYRVQVEDVVIQQASAVVPMEFPVSRWLGGTSCLWNLLMAFLFYVFLRGVWALFTTYRFPKGARIEIVELDERVSYKPLDRGNTVWLKAWLAWAIGNPDERRVIEGLRLTATRNGALLDISRGTPNWILDRLGSTFAELKELQPKKSEYKIQWDDRFESITPPGRNLFLRRGRKR